MVLKKSVFLISCLVYTLSCSILSYASERITTVTSKHGMEREIVEKTQDILSFIEPEKELYGLEEVDFSTLYLGEKIPSYRVEEGELVVSEHLYYPLISNSEWVATATVSIGELGECIVTVSTVYNDYTEGIEEATLVFEDETAFVYCEQGVLEAISSIGSAQRASESKVKDGIRVNLGKIEEKYFLQLDNAVSLRNIGTQHYLAVPLYTQPSNSTQCWAYCLKSMMEYLGTNVTIADIYEAANVSSGAAADARKATVVLDEYGHDYTAYMGQTLDWDSLRVEIYDNNSPLFAGCETGVNQNGVVIGHAVVVRGFYVYQNVPDKMGIISYMDPLVGRYLASSVDSYDTFIYTSSTTDEDYEIQDFIAAYE